jgi:hypothetical protein
MMQAVFLNTPELIDLHWPAVGDLVAPVVSQAARGEFEVEDLAAMVRSGHAVAALFSDDDCPVLGMVFEFRHYPRKQVLNIIAVGGSYLAETAMTFWPQFIAWAKESGATEIEACTAPAMTRVLRNLGFSHTYDLVRMPC